MGFLEQDGAAGDGGAALGIEQPKSIDGREICRAPRAVSTHEESLVSREGKEGEDECVYCFNFLFEVLLDAPFMVRLFC